jgi:hypothetical protein
VLVVLTGEKVHEGQRHILSSVRAPAHQSHFVRTEKLLGQPELHRYVNLNDMEGRRNDGRVRDGLFSTRYCNGAVIFLTGFEHVVGRGRTPMLWYTMVSGSSRLSI